MKRLIKLLSIFGVLIILGSCSSSKSVVANVTTIDNNSISVIISVDRTKFTDMDQTGDDYNSDITMTLRNVTAGEITGKTVQLDENITLVKGSTYELSGRYDIFSGTSFIPFTPAQFTAEISNETATTLKVIMKNGYVSTIPI